MCKRLVVFVAALVMFSIDLRYAHTTERRM